MASDRIKSVFDQVENDSDFVIGLTQELVRIPTVNPKFGVNAALSREADLQTHLAGVLEKIGLKTELWDVRKGRPNLVGTLPGSEDASLILCGHIDVVPAADHEWAADPFSGELRAGRVYGRGALDMKGGVAAAVAAVKAVLEAGIRPKGRIALHAVVDEESGSEGARDMVAKGKLAKAAIITEPSWGTVCPAEGGLDWVRVTIRGRTGHTGWRYNEIYPQTHTAGRITPSVNAIDLGVRFLTALREYERDRGRNCYHPLLPPGISTVNAGNIYAGAGIGADGLPATLNNPAITPDTFVVDLDFKSLPSEPPEQLRAEFESFVRAFSQTDWWLRDNPPEVRWDLHGVHFPPMDTKVDHPLVQSLVSNRQRVGKSTDIKGLVVVSDAAHYSAAGVSSVVYGPSGDGLHGPNEFIDVESLIETTKVLSATILDWCGVQST
jgi:acetylornithine deacetylase